ncbi:MAG TPA: hypothetical protein DCZ63_15120 [Geobacter sp.]|nr:hypothetical protein [Geobacter sp.]
MTTEILWFILAMSAMSGLIAILSALVTGYLVSRSKRESHEALFPKQIKRGKGPIVIDEFASETKHDNEDGLPPIVKQMNERMGAALAMEGLRKEK